MAHILIVGKSFSQIKQYLLSHGHTYTVLQDRLATKFPTKKYKNRVVADFSDEEDILRKVDAIQKNCLIEGTMAIYENYIVPNALIAHHLGLPGLTVDSAKACTDKEVMRTLFNRSSEKISPNFQVITSQDQLKSFASKHSFPLILKPANLAKSLLVTKNNSLSELLGNYDKALGLLATTYKKYAPNSVPKLLVEEYLDGSVYSVDVFVDAHGTPHVLENIVDYQTGYDIGYDDNFHYSRLLPSKLPQEIINEIRHAASVGCYALGMTSSPAHVEIIYTKAGARIVEIGARNGGYRDRMHGLANSIDVSRNALALLLNKPLDLHPKKNESCAVLELFPKEPGMFVSLQNEMYLRQLPSLHYFDIKAKVGKYVGRASDGYKTCTVIILHSANRKQFFKDLSYVNEQVRILTS